IKVVSVHGGPKFYQHFPTLDDFVATRVPDKKRSEYDIQKFAAYKKLRDLRQNYEGGKKFDAAEFKVLHQQYKTELQSEWLLGLGLLEVLLCFGKSETTTIAEITSLLANTPSIS